VCVRVRAGQNLTAITPPPIAYAYSRSSSLQIAHADDTRRVPSRHSAVGMQACVCVCVCVRVRAGQILTAITPPPLAYAYSRSSSLQIAHADDTRRVPSRHSAVGMQACARVCASDLSGSDIDSDADLCSDLRS